MIILIICLTFLLGLIFISASDEMTVEANFVGYGGGTFSIQVPDYISLGTINKDDPFNEIKIIINNTGVVNAIVTPQLAYNSPEVFNYTYFREHMTHNGTAVPFEKIGNFSIDVNKKNDATFYMSLNLTDFNKTLSSDDINLSTTIKFTAMAS